MQAAPEGGALAKGGSNEASDGDGADKSKPTGPVKWSKASFTTVSLNETHDALKAITQGRVPVVWRRLGAAAVIVAVLSWTL